MGRAGRAASAVRSIPRALRGEAASIGEQTRSEIVELAGHVGKRTDQVPIEKRIACANRRWYQLYITPNRTLDQALDQAMRGAAVVLIDIDDRRGQAERGAEG